ncbi:MAG: type II toxin-antitoxin system HicB family antitoxin [Firmicutes bacterium]|nr:type II toxin-antitoxin system HicB family antitoxin [Bacillota bacterium]
MKKEELEHYMNLNYAIVIRESPDGEYVAEIPELPGCITQAGSFAELQEMANDAKRSWIEAALERGIKIPEPGTGGKSALNYEDQDSRRVQAKAAFRRDSGNKCTGIRKQG